MIIYVGCCTFVFISGPFSIIYQDHLTCFMEPPQVIHTPAFHKPSHPSCSTGNRVQKGIVQVRYESPHSINKQPLFNSPAKRPHLPGAAWR